VPMGVFAGLLYIVTPDWAVAITGTARCMLGRLLLPLAPMVIGDLVLATCLCPHPPQSLVW
jgi:hypothetical protein